MAARSDRLRRAWPAVAVVALLVALAPPGAAGAARSSATPTPSAKELWKTYPLYASPDPTRAVARTAVSTAARSRGVTTAPPVPRTDRSRSMALVALGVVAGLLVAAVVLVTLHRRERTPPHRIASGGPPAAAGGPAALVPADPSLPWTAEIEWDDDAGDRAFRVVARHEGDAPQTLAESEPLPWPPAGPEAIEAMSAAVNSLSARMYAAGWRPIGAGDAWYARRFAWEPSARPGRSRFVRAGGRPAPNSPPRAGSGGS